MDTLLNVEVTQFIQLIRVRVRVVKVDTLRYFTGAIPMKPNCSNGQMKKE